MPFIAINWGWEWAFIIVGIIDFIWVIFWAIWYDKPEEQKRLSAAELEYINSDVEEDDKVEDEVKTSRLAVLPFGDW